MVSSHTKGCCNVGGSFLIHLTLSSLYTLGNLSTYVISYLRRRTQEKEITYGKSIWIMSFALCGQGTLMCLGGFLQNKIGARWTCTLGCVIYSSMIGMTYLTVNHSFLGVVFTLGLLSNLGMGIAYGAALAVAMKWFPNRKGLVGGIVVSGFGLGSFFSNQMETFFLNPHNKPPNLSDGYFTDSEVLDAVPNLFLLMGTVYGLAQLLGILLLFTPPCDQKLGSNESSPLKRGTERRVSYLNGPVPQLRLTSDPKKPEPPVIGTTYQAIGVEPETSAFDLTPKEMLKKKEFYLLWFTFALNIQVIQFVNNYYKAFGQTFIHSDHFLVLVGSCGAVINSLGRVIWGRLTDRWSYKMCMLLLCTLTAGLMFSWIACRLGGEIAYTVFVVCIFFAIAGVFALMPAITSQAFGEKHCGTNYGILFTAPAISAVVGAIFIEMMVKSLSWFTMFCIFGVIAEIAFLITVFFPDKHQAIQTL